jgi:hypothetical protein
VKEVVCVIENPDFLLFEGCLARTIPERKVGVWPEALGEQMPMQIEIPAGRMKEMKSVSVIQDAVPGEVWTYGEFTSPSFVLQYLNSAYGVFDRDEQVSVVHGTHSIVAIVRGR